jgi:hypothetical protein
MIGRWLWVVSSNGQEGMAGLGSHLWEVDMNHDDAAKTQTGSIVILEILFCTIPVRANVR